MFVIEKVQAFGFLVYDRVPPGLPGTIRCAGAIDECLAWIKKEMDPAKAPNAIGEMHARNAAAYQHAQQGNTSWMNC